MHKNKFINFLFLFFIFGAAVFLRVYFCKDIVFSDPVRYAADDGVYHMRLIENELLGEHFPKRIYFDPYTYFPYGTYHHFTPLSDQILAGFIWLAGLGKPSLSLINKIAPFYPAVLGGLVVFLVYFMGQALWDRKIGLVSAFLIAFSPPFLAKSLLGANDHHVAEVFFSCLAMLFLILALKNKEQDKNFWLYTVLTGFSLGLYFLCWTGALLFLFIIFSFIVLYFLIEFFSKSETPFWILKMGAVIFFFPLAMILPFFGHPDVFHSPMYNFQHIQSLVWGVLGMGLIGALAAFIKKKKMNHWFLLFFLVLALVIFLTALKHIFPFLSEELGKSFQAVNSSGSPLKLAREIVSEMKPLTWQTAVGRFSTLFYFMFFAFFMVFYDFIKKRKPSALLILVWTSIIILMTGVLIPAFGQNRFSYYLSINISLLAGLFIVKVFRWGWQGLRVARELPGKSKNRPYVMAGSCLIIFNILFFTVFPYPVNIFRNYPQNLPWIVQGVIGTVQAGPHQKSEDWYQVMKWLKQNTPDPGIDYYALYQEPKFNQETKKIDSYSYPKSAYGILASWGMGHIITYYAHRMPVANPFHQGVGQRKGEKVEPGEATFFLEQDEKKAIQYLNQLRTRYVITDYRHVEPNGIFKLLIKEIEGDLNDYYTLDEDKVVSDKPSKYDNSMIVRLHLFDGRGITDKKRGIGVKPLNHFRLIYESERTVAFSKDKAGEKTQEVKIFEYVKGAVIKGRAPVNKEIVLSTEIKTNQNRKFIYQNSVSAKDGYFEFVVPYSTFGKQGILAGETNFEVFASPYKLRLGSLEKEVNISEQDILQGKIIEITL